jgi:predicted Fe-Mo cluster-binding NifX family protein
MRIAIPTNDKISLFQRTGRADAFLIFDVDMADIQEVDYRKTQHAEEEHSHEEGDTHDHSHAELVDSLSDCAFIVVNQIGKHLMKDIKNAGILVFKTKEQNIKNAIADFNASRHIGEGE